MLITEIEKIVEEHSEDEEEVEFSSKCSEEDLENAFSKLAISAPNELVDLFKNTNGFSTDFTLTIWSLAEIEDTNLKYWDAEFMSDLYMRFDSLLFFAEAGNGDLFAYRVLESKVPYNDIYVWNHENDSRIWVASSLKDFITRSLKGTLEY